MKTATLRLIPLLTALVCAWGATAHAAEMVSDGSFEATGANFAPGGSDGTYCYLNYGAPLDCAPTSTSWTGSAALIRSFSGAWGNPSSLAGFSGAQGTVIAGVQNTSTLSQALTLAAGAYTLSWADAGRNYQNANNYEVLFDGNSLGTFNTAVAQGWSTHSLNFAATGAGVLTFKGLGGGADGTSFIDSVSVTSAVPEAGTVTLMVAGLAGLAIARRRRAA